MSKEYSKYQKGIINQYYGHLDTFMLQKLQELVTELYLAEGPEMKKRLWERAQKAMVNLKIPSDVISRIMEKQNIEILAARVQEWLTIPRKK
ncbi:MAG: hypothetical protein WC975_14925 [Phycisphaerae bacterium]